MRLNRSGRGVLGCCRWYLINVIRGSFFGLPFCLARFAGVVENDLVLWIVEGREDVVEEALGIREKDRKDWIRGVRSRDIGVCEDAIVLANYGREAGNRRR